MQQYTWFINKFPVQIDVIKIFNIRQRTWTVTGLH